MALYMHRKALAKVILQNLANRFYLTYLCYILHCFNIISSSFVFSQNTPPPPRPLVSCPLATLNALSQFSSCRSLTVGFLKILSLLSPLLFSLNILSLGIAIHSHCFNYHWIVGFLTTYNDTSGSPMPGVETWIYL